jgi:hypothetical protein
MKYETNGEIADKFNQPARARWLWKSGILQMPRGMTDQPVPEEHTEKPAKLQAERYLMRMEKLLLAVVILASAIGLSFVIWISALVLYVMTGESLQNMVGNLTLVKVFLPSLAILIVGLLVLGIGKLNNRLR